MSSLLKRAKDAATRVQNPLRVLGLAKGILSWGLSDDDLYEFITKVLLKRIILEIHTDQSGDDSEELREFIAAKQAIGDRGVFDEALADLRRERSAVMGEMAQTLENARRLRDQNQALEARVAELEGQIVQLREGRGAKISPSANHVNLGALHVFGSDKTSFYNSGPTVASSVLDRIPANCPGFALVRVWVKLGPKRENIEPIDLVGLKAKLNKPKITPDAREKLTNSFLRCRQRYTTFDQVRHEVESVEYVTAEGHWDLLKAVIRADLGGGHFDTKSLGVWHNREAKFPATRPVRTRYLEALDNMGVLISEGLLDELHIIPYLYQVSKGVMLWRSALPLVGSRSFDHMVIGCIAQESLQELSGRIGVDDNGTLTARTSEIADYVRPYLFHGGVLVVAPLEERRVTDSEPLAKVLQKERQFFLPGAIYDLL